jgi:hypothetical protein
MTEGARRQRGLLFRWSGALPVLAFTSLSSPALADCAAQYEAVADLSRVLYEQDQQRLGALKLVQQATAAAAKSAAESQLRSINTEWANTVAAIAKSGGVITRNCPQ